MFQWEERNMQPCTHVLYCYFFVYVLPYNFEAVDKKDIQIESIKLPSGRYTAFPARYKLSNWYGIFTLKRYLLSPNIHRLCFISYANSISYSFIIQIVAR